MKTLAILGSTGSIGQQTLDVVRQNPDRFEMYAIAAHRSWELLAKQAREFKPEIVCIADEQYYPQLKEALQDLPLKVYAGDDAIAQMVTASDIDVVMAAMVGYAGLHPTIEAIRAGKTIALANKETLVVAGELICNLIEEHKVALLPVDSEHSAIFQCLVGEGSNEIEKILLTASGGPFRKTQLADLQIVTAADALQHPNWNMGAKITIDSATMMNKGFEVIEAKWLFGVNEDKIEVVVHPQSIIHSAVQFRDGSIKAQLGMPDMRLPIQYALTFPERIKTNFLRVNLFDLQTLTFEKPDLQKFPCLGYAFEAIRKGGNAPCVLNAANEVAVAAFLHNQISFMDIPRLIEKALKMVDFIAHPTYEDYVMTDAITRKLLKD